MPSVYKDVTVEVDIDLNDFDDEALIKEMKSRGYHIEQEHDIVSIEQCWNRGDKKEALIFLEREFPELIGISHLLD